MLTVHVQYFNLNKTMNKDEKQLFLYTIYWSQDYPELRKLIDDTIEDVLEATQYPEAKQVIRMIKEKL